MRADSSTRSIEEVSSLRSAGTRSPAPTATTSPGTRRAASRTVHFPSRRTRARAFIIERIASSESRAWPSWMKPMTALTSATAKTTAASTQSPMMALSTAAASRM